MYKMVVEITKETWGKCAIKIIQYYNEKEDIIELWQKVSDLETQIIHSNICDIALESIVAKKTKDTTEEEQQKYEAFFKSEKVTFII